MIVSRQDTIDSMSTFECLSDLCLDTITICLVEFLKTGPLDVSAKCAATLMCVGSDTFTQMGMSVYNTCVDPGCLDSILHTHLALSERKTQAQEEIEQNTETLMGICALENGQHTKTTLADLKARCKLAKCGTSGTKAKLLENLCAAKGKLEQRQHVLEAILELQPPQILSKCPVRAMVRAHVAAQAHPSKITYSSAKSTYRLKDNDMDQLSFTEKRNPYYRSGPTMRLYDVSRVIAVAIEKHGPSWNNSTIEIRDPEKEADALVKANKIELRAKARLEKLRDHLATSHLTEAAFGNTDVNAYVKGSMSDAGLFERIAHVLQRAKRETLLVADLHAEGLTLRSDSKLCENYIEHGDEQNDSERRDIVTIMLEMRFYFDETNYEKIFETLASERIKDERYFNGYLSRDDFSDIYQEAKEDAKDEALIVWARKFPSFIHASARPELPESLKQRIPTERTNRVHNANGMTCRHCANRVFKSVQALDQHTRDKHSTFSKDNSRQ